MQNTIERIILKSLSTTEKAYYNALLRLNAAALNATRDLLSIHQYLEVSDSSLYQLTGIQRNPLEQLPSDCEGIDQTLFSTALLQLDTLGLQLAKNCYSISKTFSNDSSAFYRSSNNSILKETTAVELISLYPETDAEVSFDKLLFMTEHLIKFILSELIENNQSELFTVNANLNKLKTNKRRTSVRLRYDEAFPLMENEATSICENKVNSLFKAFAFSPMFVTHYPSTSKLFNVALTDSGHTLSFDYFIHGIGKVATGALLEETPLSLKNRIFEHLNGSKTRHISKLAVRGMEHYISTLERAECKRRGGIVIHFDKLLSAVFGNHTNKPAHEPLRELTPPDHKSSYENKV